MLSLFPLLFAPLIAANTPSLPAGCESQPLSYAVYDFKWFNSTHNLDCTIGHPDTDRICWNNGPPDYGVCDPRTDSTCMGGRSYDQCPRVCANGVPDTPLGYGPPDVVSWVTPDMYVEGEDRKCYSKNPGNPGNIRTHNVGDAGDGRVECGSIRNLATFVGDSNQDEGEQGRIAWYVQKDCNGTGKYFGYEALFDLSCSRDIGGNATCESASEDITANLFDIQNV